MQKPDIQRKAPPPKPVKRRPLWPKVLGGVVVLIVLLILLIPRLLVSEATQKPADAGTFVTRQEQTSTTLQDKMQQSLNNNGSPTGNSGTSAQPDNSGQATGTNQSTEMNNSQSAGQTSNSGSSGNTQAAQPATPPDNQASGQSNPQSPDQTQAHPNSTNTAQSTPAPANSGGFKVALSEGEISSMIYSGLVERTAPEYRQSIQGVSTRISGGRATITVALLPRYLPDAFLNNLPGVTHDTPTVYLGGEVGLHREGDSVGADIYHLSLGNLNVPMPFIREAVAATVRDQAAQMLHLPNGQQAKLDDVVVDSGAITLQGHVN